MRYFLYVAAPTLSRLALTELDNARHFAAVCRAHMDMKRVVMPIYDEIITHLEHPDFKMLLIHNLPIDDLLAIKAVRAVQHQLQAEFLQLSKIG